MLFNTFQLVLTVAALLRLGATQSAECGLTCIANVNGTDCAQSEWSCLCQNNQYLQGLSACVSRGCNQTDYDATISAVAEICAIFDSAPTISPFATATTGTENPLFSTVAIPSVGTLPSPSASSSSSIDNIAGTSISTFTTSGVATGSGVAATASASTTNVAQKVDLKTTALHGIAVALLGLAVYL